jgi:3-dehydroquinate synthase
MNHALATDRARRTGVWENPKGFLLCSPEGSAYPVDIGENVLEPENPLLADHLKGRRVCVFAGPTVERLYGERMRAYLRAHLPVEDWAMTTMPGTERSKSLATVEWVCAFARQAGLDRHGVMVALGGGITTDTIGFAASIYARGVDYVKVNTSLVGQVDAGVGIKTGVNGIGAKNMLGAYHVPY